MRRNQSELWGGSFSQGVARGKIAPSFHWALYFGEAWVGPVLEMPLTNWVLKLSQYKIGEEVKHLGYLYVCWKATKEWRKICLSQIFGKISICQENCKFWNRLASACIGDTQHSIFDRGGRRNLLKNVKLSRKFCSNWQKRSALCCWCHNSKTAVVEP